jgi:hypothetical protein
MTGGQGAEKEGAEKGTGARLFGTPFALAHIHLRWRFVKRMLRG